LLKSACPYLKADAGLVAVPSRGGACLQPIAASGDVPSPLLKSDFTTDQGIMGWIFQNRKSLVIRKFRSRSRIPFLLGPEDGIVRIGALIGMPLAWRAEEVGGVIAFVCRKEANWSKEEIVAITAVVRRITLVLQNFTLRRELALARNLDPVTEVCNTGAFDRVLEKRMTRCRKSGTNLGLGIVTIKGFDRLSANVPVPDLAPLRQRIAATLLKLLKGNQLMGCLDSERFAVLFEEETPGEIHNRLKAMTQAVHKEIQECLGGGGALEADFGFALYPQDATASDELWTKAFQALFNRSTEGPIGMKYAER
jgi:GGDEF domain-containing protein